MKELEEKHTSRSAKRSLSFGAGLFLVAGPLVSLFLQQMFVGLLLFALGGTLFALWSYFDTGDKVAAGVLIFVALVIAGMRVALYFLGP